MTVRTTEMTRWVARPAFSNFSVRAFQRLACVAGAILVLVTAISLPSLAAPINYGDFAGATVTYTQVTEDANSSDDAPPLFGAPTVSGDSIDFNPVGFNAASSGGGADITDGQLTFGVKADTDYAINNLSLSEAGDTTLAGIGNDGTITVVRASGILNVHEVDGVGIDVLSLPISLSFSPSNGDWGLLTDGGGGPFFHTQWSGSQLLDVNQLLINNNVDYDQGATRISVNLDNVLIAVSQAGTTALIAKKNFGGLSITVNVPPPGGGIPEPTSVALAGLALLAMAAGWRRGR